MSLYEWAHRHGLARMLNGSSNNYNNRCSIWVETWAPKSMGHQVARYTLRHTRSMPQANWATVRVESDPVVIRESGRLRRYRWRLHYQRV